MMVTLSTAKFRVAGLLALAISAIAVAGCGSSSSSTSSASAATPAASPASSTTSTAAAAAGITIKTATGSAGTYLVGPNGKAIYLWAADTGDKSSCSGACATAWPPVTTTGKPTAGAGVNAADLGTTTRSDGSEEVTYKGHPLYYFIADKSAGDTKGQGSNNFGAKWWLVAPSGDAITSSGSSSGSGAYGGGSSSSSSSHSGGGWG
jgi:predicted lipoprotein with Yx(FWY)xxD motif